MEKNSVDSIITFCAVATSSYYEEVLMTNKPYIGLLKMSLKL